MPEVAKVTIHNRGYHTHADRVDNDGKATIRYASKIRHLGIGSAHRGKHVLMLIHNDHVTTSDTATGEILTEHLLDATRDYQPPTWRKPRTE